MQVQKVQQQQSQQVQAQQGAAASKNETVAGASTFSTSEAGRADLAAAVNANRSVEQPVASSIRGAALAATTMDPKKTGDEA